MSVRQSDAGFTLVEVMIALMIFAMIASAGVALLAFSVRAQAATDARLDDVAAVARTNALLTGDLMQALDRPARDQGGGQRPAFVGTNGDGTFLTLTRAGWSNLDASPRASIQRVEYRLSANGLERVAYPRVDGAAALPPALILAPVSAVRMRYRFAGAWSDTWDGTQGAPLPQAAEMTVERPRGVAFRMMFLVGAGWRPRAEELQRQGAGDVAPPV